VSALHPSGWTPVRLTAVFDMLPKDSEELLTYPQLHVAYLEDNSTGLLSPKEVAIHSDNTKFDRSKRVALSRLGFVALIRSTDIYVIIVQ
jgi:hypothetical protein